MEQIHPKYKYHIYGLNIISDFCIPDLITTENPSEIMVLKGKVPENIIGATVNNEFFQASRDELIFRIKGIGKYYISKGNLIIIELEEKANFNTVKLYLLGTAFAALLLQRCIIPIHGSAVVINDKCIIITGESGVGKSTLSSGFLKRGFSLLTDDVAALTFDNEGCVFVQPSYPQQKLWRDSIEIFGGKVNSYTQIYNETDKFAVPIHENFMKKPMPLSAVFELKKGDYTDVQIQNISGMHKLSLLMNNTYRPQLLNFFNLYENHFKQCTLIANRISAYRLIRPENIFSTDKLIKIILDNFENDQIV